MNGVAFGFNAILYGHCWLANFLERFGLVNSRVLKMVTLSRYSWSSGVVNLAVEPLSLLSKVAPCSLF